MSLKTVISISFIFITVYALSIIGDWAQIALLLVSVSPVLILWMAYRILKEPYDTNETFEDKFYEDYDYRRNE